MSSLSLIIPGRNEMFFARTVECALNAIRGDTEVIAVCDGSWPDPPLADHPRLNVVHFTEPVGQRAATNAGARIGRGKYMMKADAHCNFDEGFDVKLMEPYESGELGSEVTTIPRMYNLYGFDWVCEDGHRRYQSPSGPCTECGKPTVRDIQWRPRLSRKTDFARFDKTPQFQYWKNYKTRPEAQGDIADTMCHVGAGWFMRMDRYWELGGLDERHGSWGQVGIETSCKAWLSGGRLVVNKRTWFAHMFRTQGSDFGFPYPISPVQQEKAREHSRWLWFDGNWEGMKRPLSWLVEKFAPVPGWHDAPA